MTIGSRVANTCLDRESAGVRWLSACSKRFMDSAGRTAGLNLGEFSLMLPIPGAPVTGFKSGRGTPVQTRLGSLVGKKFEQFHVAAVEGEFLRKQPQYRQYRDRLIRLADGNKRLRLRHCVSTLATPEFHVALSAHHPLQPGIAQGHSRSYFSRSIPKDQKAGKVVVCDPLGTGQFPQSRGSWHDLAQAINCILLPTALGQPLAGRSQPHVVHRVGCRSPGPDALLLYRS